MGLLTREAERRALAWLLVDSDDNNLPVTQPIMIRLVSANGTTTTAGTEISGDVYEPTQTTWGFTATIPGAEFVNATTVSFTALDADASVSVAGVELWDSSSTPLRVGYAALPSPVTIPAGQPFEIAPGQLKVKLV